MTPMAVGLAIPSPMIMYIMRMACMPQKLTKSHIATPQMGEQGPRVAAEHAARWALWLLGHRLGES